MQIPKKILKSGFTLPVLGLGTWQIGGGIEHNSYNDDNRDITAIREAIEQGVSHIDTAEKYANGYADVLVGKAIKNYARKKLFITTKVAETHLHHDDLISSAKRSLERLQVDYIDLYLIHSPNTTIPIIETMQALDELVNKNFVKYIGVSNFSIEQFKEAQACTKNKIVTNQLHYNLRFREVERVGMLTFCQENDVLLTAYRPLQKGLLAASLPIMTRLAGKYKKTPAQIAINWLISQKNVVTILKTANQQHLLEAIGAVDWIMDERDVEILRKKFPDQQEYSDVVPIH